MSTTSIQWTEQTWNPVAGCSIVSPGCTHCYAMRMAARLEAMGKKKYVGLTKKVKSGKKSLPVWTGKIALDDDALAIPLKRKKPTIWFVNSMIELSAGADDRKTLVFILREFIGQIEAGSNSCVTGSYSVCGNYTVVEDATMDGERFRRELEEYLESQRERV